MNLNELDYQVVEGSRRDQEVVIYALSPCGFCKRAISFLKDKDYAFRYIISTSIPLRPKTRSSRCCGNALRKTPAFPFAVIDDSQHLIGFIQPDWEKNPGA
jgi:glutaredoxin